MTKRDLAKLIIEHIENVRFMKESEFSEDNIKKEQIEGIESLLDTLEPKNRDRFSKWGNHNQQSTAGNCW